MLAAASSVVAAAPPGGKPTITISSPANGATVHGSTVTIHVAISHFKLVPPVLLSPAQWKTIPLLKGNQGHIHYVLDSVANLVLTRDVTMRLDHTWTHVSPGWHTAIAYLATSQHAPFPGAREASIRVHVVPNVALVSRPSRAAHTAPHTARSAKPTTGIRSVQTKAGKPAMKALPRTGGAGAMQYPLLPIDLLAGVVVTLVGLSMLAYSSTRRGGQIWSRCRK
jgi:hypothetical protein